MNKWNRFVHRFLSRPIITRFFSRFVSQADILSLRLSKGKFSPSQIIAGWMIVTLTTTGAKSGLPRTTPLIGIKDDRQIILIASNFGRHNHPAWYYNLKAHPIASINLNGLSATYLAHEVSEEDYDKIWQIAIATNPGYDSYRQQTHRKIPIFILEPRDKLN